MAILPGKRLGPYEILSAIGAGGMGEVYRARDTRLDRIVAIKVLPAHLADDPERRERFEREARTIASLNHPHICVLHDIGRQDRIDYLVMEYLEGGTLAQRLLKGPLPLEQVLQYAIEIADALDKAHRKGVTHRDLKPSNIMLTKAGTKLLDFGLAKLRPAAAPATPLSELPTEPDAITAEGAIVGTLRYMAPEQLESKGVDARTDIFAFGSVVYEMATGKRAFEGKSQASVIGAIMSSEPLPMSSLQPMTPPALDRLVKKCLAKEPEKRWQASSDVCDELKWIAEESTRRDAPPLRPTAPKKVLRRWIVASALACLIVAGVAGLAVWILKPSPATPVSRSVFSLPPDERFPENLSQQLDILALAPDGKHLVYVAVEGGAQQLYLRSLDSFEARPILGTEGGFGPFFSPDSQWVGFFAGGKLKKVLLSGGATVTVCDALNPGGATWGSNDRIVFARIGLSGLWVVPAAGGTPQQLTTLDSKKAEIGQVDPEFLPGGKAVLFEAVNSSINGGGDAPLALYVLKTGERRDLSQLGTNPRYAPSGHLLYVQGANLMAGPFDPGRMALTGAPLPVVEGVKRFAANGAAQYSFSDNGTLAYLPGASVQAAQRKLVWVDRKGAEQPIPAPPQAYRAPRVSPDGRRVAVSIEELGTQLWTYDLGRETLTRLTFEGNSNLDPVWTPDGKRVAFSSGSPRNLFWLPADGSGKAERLANADYIQVPNSFSPDGQTLSFHEVNPTSGRDLWVLPLSDRKPQLFLRTPFNEAAPRFSPDGHWLVYVSDESGRNEIYVQPYPGPGGKWQISTDGGTEPLWNPKGRELFYRLGNKMMAVEVATQPSFSAGKPRMLFEGHYVPTLGAAASYDVSPDGQRFLMLKPSEQAQAAPTQINVVLNWFEELKQRVPAGKK